ncbi:hypothetical protein GH714_015280 [Hevea brasiliensis]|uniref:RING-type E3 ubiquitin transferase n=1 Tax=Hevea brasiliensis TaxID=3981 RepID=A0A6A6KP22_HEVBR|nr:hypothetical protein GH714_015280 [Hevea brasiliensis]
MRLMYDPVVIASGQTFERMWIQKWFDDGNNACPKTKVKLPHCSLTPNTAMKHLISRWCEKHGVTIPDPSVQVFHSLDVSSTSITSLGSSMNDLHLPLDISNISFGSLDASYSSDSSRTRFADGSSLMLTRKTEDCLQFQSHASIIETDSEFLTRLSELNWDSQCKMVEDINSYLQYNNQSCYSMSSENFVDPLFRFLKDACEQHDARAQRAGSQLLLAFVSQNRSGLSYLHEDSFNLLVSFLDSEVTEETLAILEVLSGDPYCRTKITAAGALVPVLKILDSQSKEFQERAIKILHNLSSNCDICSQIISLECIPKLVPLINEGRIARYCMVLLKNLCETEKARIAVVETNGFISSVAELLESGSREEQEHAVAVLLSLCSQRPFGSITYLLLYQTRLLHGHVYCVEKQQARLKWLQHYSLQSDSMPHFLGFFDNGDTVHSKRRPGKFLGSSDLEKYDVAALSIEIDHCLPKTSCRQVGIELEEAAKMEDGALMERCNPATKEFVQIREKQSILQQKNLEEVEVQSKVKEKTSTEIQQILGRKITRLERAGLLDEVINYVQSLQGQVEFLSMKLATLAPRQGLNGDNFSGKEQAQPFLDPDSQILHNVGFHQG